MPKQVHVESAIADADGKQVVDAGIFRLQVDSVQIMPGRREVHIVVNRINTANFEVIPIVFLVPTAVYDTLQAADMSGAGTLHDALQALLWSYLETNHKRHLVFGRPDNWLGADEVVTLEWIDV